MKDQYKRPEEILQKLGIEAPNEMQQEAYQSIITTQDTILLSPTGTGKTLAFLLPILEQLDPNLEQTQVMILVPSRELAIQIEQVIRDMGSGYKTNAVYGGRSASKDRMELKHPPIILVGTPGRVADHLRRSTIGTQHIKFLVLDEFDKSLEVGFEKEMMEIVAELRNLEKKILTSATQKVAIPEFVGLKNPTKLDFSGTVDLQLKLRSIISPDKDKLNTLEQLLSHIGSGNGIIFCNLKDTISIVSDFLDEKYISHVCFFGGMEQQDRERALIKFRNGSCPLLVATDLAARGIDVPEMDFIIHFELPFKEEEFTHRNGRTARMHQNGAAYIIRVKDAYIHPFLQDIPEEKLVIGEPFPDSKWTTLFISGGRKDKISKGDIAGLFFKQGELEKDELGTIELKQDCAFVAVPKAKARQLIQTLNNSKLKNKKVRISWLE